ncbi:hypothetical protein Bbelb_414180 [Branchiostoma belcheri]|nr:hypothetical protein Bbelb_414180 [Branchiostoma belcheri]
MEQSSKGKTVLMMMGLGRDIWFQYTLYGSPHLQVGSKVVAAKQPEKDHPFIQGPCQAEEEVIGKMKLTNCPNCEGKESEYTSLIITATYMVTLAEFRFDQLVLEELHSRDGSHNVQVFPLPVSTPRRVVRCRRKQCLAAGQVAFRPLPHHLSHIPETSSRAQQATMAECFHTVCGAVSEAELIQQMGPPSTGSAVSPVCLPELCLQVHVY